MSSALDTRPTRGMASPADSLRTVMQQDSLTPAPSSRSPTCRQRIRTRLTQVDTAFDAGQRFTGLRVPLIWGAVFGLLQAAAPLGLWWIRPAAVYGISLVLIAAVYLGFAVADGRQNVVAIEVGVTSVFVMVGAVAVAGSLSLIWPGSLATARRTCGSTAPAS